MGRLLEIVSPLHKKTQRDYVDRMSDSKVECMEVAKRYGEEYWDGDRRYGYGGYRYDGRWSVVAEKLIETYDLPRDAKILDIGCGKGFLLHELKKLRPGAGVAGMDISAYALGHCKDEVRAYLRPGRAQDSLPFGDGEFDLVISITTLHNLPVDELSGALAEMERVGRNQFLVVESYRSERELFNLQCWALTCASFFTPQEWVWLFDRSGYSGDYEFIYFE